MGDVVSIEVDGEPGEPRFEGSREPPAWGLPLAIVVVGTLVLCVGWTLLRSGGAPAASSAAPTATTTTTRSSSAATSAPPAPSVPAHMAVTAEPSEPIPNMHDPVEAARTGLAAWGHFAATGDLTHVRRSFAAGGPQLVQLEDEARRGPSQVGTSLRGYVVTLREPQAEVLSGVATVTGTVFWSRAGEADRTYRWAIELRQADDGSWRLFTVRTLQG